VEYTEQKPILLREEWFGEWFDVLRSSLEADGMVKNLSFSIILELFPVLNAFTCL